MSKFLHQIGSGERRIIGGGGDGRPSMKDSVRKGGVLEGPSSTRRPGPGGGEEEIHLGVPKSERRLERGKH